VSSSLVFHVYPMDYNCSVVTGDYSLEVHGIPSLPSSMLFAGWRVECDSICESS
jgi:hypothetical protein